MKILFTKILPFLDTTVYLDYMLEAIVIEPRKTAKSCVIWLHGLGADGHDFENIIPDLELPTNHTTRFIFPHAPYRPVTLNRHMEMRAWYDIRTLDNLDYEDEEGIQQTTHEINNIIQDQKMDPQQIILAGFSQGGAMALWMGVTAEKPYAGIIALSTYLPFLHIPNKRPAIKHKTLPILQCHGTYDDVIPAHIGKATYDYLRTGNNAVEWKEYKIGHQVCMEEIKAIGAWLSLRLKRFS